MGLVDYSSSSDSETEAKPQPAATKPTPTRPVSTTARVPAQGGKKVVEKLRGADGKIRVNLAAETKKEQGIRPAADDDEDRPAKRARTGQGGAFSGFNSFLPPPTNRGGKTGGIPASDKKKDGGGGGGGGGTVPFSGAPRPGVHLKTGAAPGFSRGADGTDGLGQAKRTDGPAIPEGMKSEEEVKLVGKPLMFKPLSVARKMGKKNSTKLAAKAPTPAPITATPPMTTGAAAAKAPKSAALPPKKVSLFSLPAEEEDRSEPTATAPASYEYETMAPQAPSSYETATTAISYGEQPPRADAVDDGSSTSLASIADDLNLSASARRDLFGRANQGPGAAGPAPQVRSFDLDREYRANEAWRASGEADLHQQQQQQARSRPVHSLMAGGKTNLRQLVSHVANQRDALEESFASGKNKRKEASGRYGW